MASEQPLLDRYRWVILGMTALAVMAAFGYLLLDQDQPVTITINPPLPTASITPTGTLPPTETPPPLQIYVTGAVENPESRLSLPPGSRVEEAIAAAGGATENADLSRVNLAQVLRDGDQVHVPALQTDAPPPTQAPESVPAETEAPVIVENTAIPIEETPTPNAPRLLDLNTATQAELEELPDIGPATAQAIIDYRETNGGFKTVDELDNVRGIGTATLEKLRPLVTVE